MAATEDIDNYKNVSKELNHINSLLTWSATPIELESSEIPKVGGIISKEENGFRVEVTDFEFQRLDRRDRINTIKVKVDNTDYIINGFSIDSSETNLDVVKGKGRFQNICSFNELQSIDFKLNHKTKYKCFISTPISKLPQLHYVFETVTYQDDKTNHFYDCLRIRIDNKIFDLTQIQDHDKGYYLIENFDAMDFESFSEFAYSIKQAFGYVTSYMPGGEEYFFSEELSFYYRNHHRPSIKSMFKPLHYNPYHLLHQKREIAESYLDKLNRMSLQVFSDLVTSIHKHEQFSALILLMLDATSVRSFLVIPSLFAVAIESLSKLIVKGETGKEFLITNPDVSIMILDKLNKVIDDNLDRIGDKNHAKLKARIQGLNRPINKEHLTNDEKLIQPFDQLGITLNENDILTITHRNDLLHGNILLEGDIIKTEGQKDNYMGYVSAKLATLINTLILKYVGYSGYIINHSKFYEESCEIDTKEEYYRLI